MVSCNIKKNAPLNNLQILYQNTGRQHITGKCQIISPNTLPFQCVLGRMNVCRIMVTASRDALTPMTATTAPVLMAIVLSILHMYAEVSFIYLLTVMYTGVHFPFLQRVAPINYKEVPNKYGGQ